MKHSSTTCCQSEPIPVIFLGGIPLDTDREEFLAFLETFGPVNSLEIACERRRKKNRQNGFAKATFCSLEDSKSFLEQPSHVFRGLVLGVKIWTDKSEHVQSKLDLNKKRLFVRHHPDLTESDLFRHFSRFGQIEEVDFKLDHASKVSRGFSFVLFTSEDTKLRAQTEGNLTDAERYITCEPCIPTSLMKRQNTHLSSETEQPTSCQTSECHPAEADKVSLQLHSSQLHPRVLYSSTLKAGQGSRGTKCAPTKKDEQVLQEPSPNCPLRHSEGMSYHYSKPTSVKYISRDQRPSKGQGEDHNLVFRLGQSSSKVMRFRLYRLFC